MGQKMKIEARKANMKQYQLRELMNEAAELHKRFDCNNREQARFNIDLVARALIARKQ